MGTRVAPTYANLFMKSLKQKYIYPHAHCPRIWFRFIDDIWGIFRGTECHGLKIRVFYFLYIPQTFQINWISFMVAQVNAVLLIHWFYMGDRVRH